MILFNRIVMILFVYSDVDLKLLLQVCIFQSFLLSKVG